MVTYNPLKIGQRVVHEYVHHGVKQERVGVFIGFVKHRGGQQRYKGEQLAKVKLCEAYSKRLRCSHLPVRELRDVGQLIY